MHSRAYSPQGMDIDRRKFCLNFAVSLFFHLVFFTAFILFPDLKTGRTFSPSVINVSMVSLAELEALPGSKQPTISRPEDVPVSKTPSKESVALEKKPSKPVSEAPQQWKAKESLKKQTYKPSKIVKSAVSRIEKKVEETRPDPISEAVDRLKDKVEKTQPMDSTRDTVDKGMPRKGYGVPGGAVMGGAKILELIDIYKHQVAYDVEKNWAFSVPLAGGRTDLIAYLSFKVMPNGEIMNIQFDKRSGNRYLDESAQKAIMKSSPVRPHPPGINKPYVTVGLRFTPEGIE